MREVHHRIKNNLQGVVGLLRQQAAEQPEVAPLLVATLAQLQSVAVVHGLQARGQHDEVRLCEMVEGISRTAAHWGARAATRGAGDPEAHADCGRRVCSPGADTQRTAIRHGGAPGDGVRVSVHSDGGCAEVRVHNPRGTLPPGFDFERGKRLGTGLSLIKSLLPPEGAELRIRADQGGVTACLRVTHPVLVRPAAS